MPRPIAEADREIESFAGQIDSVVVGEQPQIDPRMRCAERGQARQQPAGREGPYRRHRQQLCGLAAGDPLDQFGHAIEALGEHRQERHALVCKRQPARQPPE